MAPCATSLNMTDTQPALSFSARGWGSGELCNMVKWKQDGASNAVWEHLVQQTSPCVINRVLSAVRTTGGQ